MVDSGEIKATAIFGRIEPDQIQPASIDLRLGEYAYRVETSFLPGRDVKVLDKMQAERKTRLTEDERAQILVFLQGPGASR